MDDSIGCTEISALPLYLVINWRARPDSDMSACQTLVVFAKEWPELDEDRRGPNWPRGREV